MLIRIICLVGMLLLAFSSQVAFAEDDGLVVYDDLRRACAAAHEVCYQSCRSTGYKSECFDRCDETAQRCLESIPDSTPSRQADAQIRTGAGLCLDVHAPDLGNNGGRVQAWTCNGAVQQRWTYDPAARAVRAASGLCLDVHAPEATTNGGRVQVWACNGQPQQQWTPGANRSLRNAGGLCLDVHAPDQTSNGARVQVWQCNGSQQQRFISRAFADPRGKTFSKPGGVNSSGN
jgi:hypothetical protein